MLSGRCLRNRGCESVVHACQIVEHHHPLSTLLLDGDPCRLGEDRRNRGAGTKRKSREYEGTCMGFSVAVYNRGVARNLFWGGIKVFGDV